MLRFVDSFSHYVTAGIATKYTVGSGAVDATGGRLSGGCWSGTFGPSKTLERPLIQMMSTTGIAYKTSGLANSPMGWTVTGSDPDHLGSGSAPYSLNAVRINHVGDGTLYCSYQGYYISGDTGSPDFDPIYTKAGTNGAQFSLPGSQLLQTYQWYYIELKVYWSGGIGDVVNPIQVEVRINGDVVLTEAPVFTTGDHVDHALMLLEFGDYAISWSGAGGGLSSQICDLYTLDDQGTDNTDYLGDVHVGVIFAREDGTYGDWTPDTGTDHFSRVNEHAHDGDTSVVSANAADSKDTYFFDPVLNTGNVYGVQLNNTVRKQDAGTRIIQATTRSGGTDADSGVDERCNTTYSDRHHIWEREPSANVAWTPVSIDAAEFGAKLIA